MPSGPFTFTTDLMHGTREGYGMPIKKTDEAACVAWLMRMYQQKVGEQK